MDDTGHSGFTLIELLLVVSLVALLAGLALPAMAHFIDKARLRGAAETLVQDLRQARNRALTYQQTVYFSFVRGRADSWCYGWSDRADCDCRLAASQPGACLSGTPATAHLQRRQSTEFPTLALTLPAGSLGFSTRFAALRGTATAATLGLANKAGEIRIVISPLGRIRTCTPHGRRLPAC